MTLPKTIRRLRRLQNLTQKQLAELTGLSMTTVQKIETGARPLASGELELFAQALGVPIAELKNPVSLALHDLSIPVALSPGARLPERASAAAAGFELRAPGYAYLPRLGAAMIDTGVSLAVPQGFVGIVCPGGVSRQSGILADGLIAAGDEGPLRVKLYNLSERSYEIRPGDPIAQLLFVPVSSPLLENTAKGAEA